MSVKNKINYNCKQKSLYICTKILFINLIRILLMPQSTNVNLPELMKNPRLFGDYCYNLRKSLDDELVPKSFFSNICDCEVKQISQIESGFIYSWSLAVKYLLALQATKKYFE